MDRVRLTRGARTLVQTMKAYGAHSVLVTGGFTAFANPVGEAIGFDRVVANELVIAGGKLAGTVAEPIVDKDAKPETLKSEAAKHGLPLADTLAVGEGEQDITMLAASGLGLAYTPPQAATDTRKIDRYGKKG